MLNFNLKNTDLNKLIKVDKILIEYTKSIFNGYKIDNNFFSLTFKILDLTQTSKVNYGKHACC